MLLPNHAYKRTAAYVDDHAQGARTFDELLQGYRDFLALCQQKNWTLNATKTKVGYPSCVFFGFEVDIHGTRLADKNLDPVRRMVLIQLTGTPQHARRVRAIVPLHSPIRTHRRSSHRSHAQRQRQTYVWDDNTQSAYDTIRNLP